jgi:hypothetical protein
VKTIFALFGSGLMIALLGASCSAQEKNPPTQPSNEGHGVLDITPGEAGGTYNQTIKASATVTAVDHEKRLVTLKTDAGREVEFEAEPEIRNFDQIKVGDKVNATVNSQVVVYVVGAGEPSATHREAIMRAPKGAKPGAVVARQFELKAKIKAIDKDARVATLQFVDGETHTVEIRPDVDLSRYHVTDNVVIVVTQQLTLLVEAP